VPEIAIRFPFRSAATSPVRAANAISIDRRRAAWEPSSLCVKNATDISITAKLAEEISDRTLCVRAISRRQANPAPANSSQKREIGSER
jgi:hypothetical protein